MKKSLCGTGHDRKPASIFSNDQSYYFTQAEMFTRSNLPLAVFLLTKKPLHPFAPKSQDLFSVNMRALCSDDQVHDIDLGTITMEPIPINEMTTFSKKDYDQLRAQGV